MIKQNLSQKMLLKLSPQQIQLMKLFQIPTASLEQRIQQELEENPALEELKLLDLNSLTPLEALNKLSDFKKKLDS